MNDIYTLYNKSIVSHKKRNWDFLKRYEEQVISLYKDGYSELKIAKLVFDTSEITDSIKRSFVRRILESANIQRRTVSQQLKVDYSSGRRDKYKATKSANYARKGSKVSKISKIKKAKTIENNAKEFLNKSKYENEFYNFLKKENVNFEYQKAIDIYNIDFCFNNIAVELTGGNYRNYNDKDFNQKRKTLLQNGITEILVIRCNKYFDAKETYKFIKQFKDKRIIEIDCKRRKLTDR